MNDTLKEKGLENLIEKQLLQHGGFERDNGTYLAEWCLDWTTLKRFLESTQPEALERIQRAEGSNWEGKLRAKIFAEIGKRGLADTLRSGVLAGAGERLRLYFPRPATTLNPRAVGLWSANRFTVARQLRFSVGEPLLSLDVVLLVNGLPAVTLELKNAFTGQTAHDAKRQYQERDAREPIFAPGRCLAHFAVDSDLAFMSSHVAGQNTHFYPFNRGFNAGAGNPPRPFGLKTDYLWREVLTRDGLALLLEKYAHVLEMPHEGKKVRRPVFPRYHQLDAVQKLLTDAAQHGAGRKYLIQHSAGSGKSNTIAWLAHQLTELQRADAQGALSPVFDSIIVVTDRRVLDKQIRDTLKDFVRVQGVVAAVESGSFQLREALQDGKKIIVSTIQKFPHILDQIGALSGQKFAVIIDEAHSGQGGKNASSLNTALGTAAKTAVSEEEDDEDRINRLIAERASGRKMQANVSYFAFTATPKNRTLETFGTRRPSDDKFGPFHEYTMKQAIEEGFILDVLRGYVTYDSYYKIAQTIDDDPEVDARRARKKIKQWVESHEHAIGQKVEIMVDHFVEHIFTPKRLNGQARAMIVTNSIQSAIRYKLAFDAYRQAANLPFEAIVAFSGSKAEGGQNYDEATMNGFPSTDIPANFKKPPYRFLIVAEKFQTGFDEPLLMAMYVDKPLSDVQAVQTLSRLNRICPPHKDRTFIVDFVNTPETIREAFDPFYKTTILSEAADLNRLNELQDSLDRSGVYDPETVPQVLAQFLQGAGRESFESLLDNCALSYSELSPNEQIEFKGNAKGFVRFYSFISAIRPFVNIYWEALEFFLKLLLTKLPSPAEDDLSKGVLDAIDMDSYRAQKRWEQNIALIGDIEIAPVPAQMGGGVPAPELDHLSNIVSDFNERFGTDWTDADQVRRFLFEELPRAVSRNAEYRSAREHSDPQNARITYGKKLDEVFQGHVFDQTELYRRFAQDPEFKKWLADMLFGLDLKGHFDNPPT